MPWRAPPPARRGCGRRRSPACFSCALIASKSGLRNSFHSVTMTSASAPSSAVHRASRRSRRGLRRRRCLRASCHRDRVVGAHLAPRAEQVGDQRAARRLAHVVGVRLEREAPEREAPARRGRRRSAARSSRRARCFCRSLTASTARSTLQRSAPRSLARCAAAPSRPSGSTSRRSPRRGRGSGSRCAGRSRCRGARPRCRRRASRRGCASSFMNEMRVASIALAAYLVSSAERTSITMHALVVALERRVELAHQRDRRAGRRRR